ncbi:hypothetical protein A2U01_0067112, partial [Trifolium medium]|nr:hypothetical protein [Trifolium medium]
FWVEHSLREVEGSLNDTSKICIVPKNMEKWNYSLSNPF